MTITVTLNFQTAAEAATALSLLAGAPAATAATATTAVSAEEKAAVAGKPSAATTARSSRTAEAGRSKPDPSAAAPAPSTPPPAPAPSPDTTDAPDAPPFPYADLQKLVIKLHTQDPAKTAGIAAELGVKSFKELPHTRWAEAKAKVEEALAAAEVA